MAIHIGFATRKGGEGKTFCAVNIAGELLSRGYRVLVVVCDEQEDLPNRYLIDQPAGEKQYDENEHDSLEKVLAGECSIENAIYKSRRYPSYRWGERAIKAGSTKGKPQREERGRTRISGKMYQLEVVPAGNTLNDIEDAFFEETEEGLLPKYWVLDDVLSPLEDRYDFIIFDIPPAELSISFCAYASSDFLVMPFASVDSLGAIRKMSHSLDVIADIPGSRRMIKPVLLANKYHKESQMDDDLIEIAKDIFEGHVLQQTIRYSREADYAKLNGIPLVSTKKTLIGEDISYATDELLQYAGMPARHE